MSSQIWVSWTGEGRGAGGGCPSHSQWSLVKPCREKVIRLKNRFQNPSLMHRMRQPGALSSVVFFIFQLTAPAHTPAATHCKNIYNLQHSVTFEYQYIQHGTGVSRRRAAHRSIPYSAGLREQLENLFSAEKR